MTANIRKDNTKKFFVISVCILIFLYLSLILFGYLKMDVNVLDNKNSANSIINLGHFLLDYLLPFLIVLMCSFYIIEIKEVYYIVGVMALDLTIWILRYIWKLTPEAVIKMIFSILIILFIFLFPLINYLFSFNKRVEIGFLICSYLIATGYEVTLVYFNTGLNCKLINILGNILIFSLMFITLFSLHFGKKNNFAGEDKSEL